MGQVVSWLFFYDAENNSDDETKSVTETEYVESITSDNEIEIEIEMDNDNDNDIRNINVRNNLLMCQKILFEEYDNWSKNDEIMNVLNDPKNTLIMRLKTLYPEYNDKYIQSLALAFYMNTYQILSV